MLLDTHRAQNRILAGIDASRECECDISGWGRGAGSADGDVQVAQAVGEGKACMSVTVLQK